MYRKTGSVLAISLLLLTIITLAPISPVWSTHSTDPWGPTGPRTKNVLISIYPDELAEFIAFENGELDLTDSPVPALKEQPYGTNPDFHLTEGIGALDFFDMEFNHANKFWGIPFNFGNDPNGVQIRQAFAHLVDKSTFISENVLQGRGQAIDNPVPPAQGLAGPPTGPWDPLHATISAYNIRPDSLGTPASGSPDFLAARDHLLQVRGAQGNQVFFDANNDGVIDNPPSERLLFFIRSDHEPRRQAGISLAGAIQALLGADVVDERFGNIQSVSDIVFRTFPSVLDWHMYTGGWRLGPFWDHLYALYHSQFASNLCGGKKSSFAQNYIFACIPQLDTEAFASVFATSFSESAAHAVAALDVFGRNVVTIPVYSSASRMVYRAGWTGVVNQLGAGVANFFTLLSMRPDGTKPGVPAIPDTIRWGFKQGTSHLSMFHAQTLWEFFVLNEIYDTLLEPNPRNNGQLVDWMTNRHQVFINPLPGDIGYTPPTGTNTTVRFFLKNNLVWQDGVSLTPADIKFSIINYRDVPSANLLSLVAQVIDVKALTSQIVDIHLSGISIFHELNMGLLPIIPQHLWDLNQDGIVDLDKVDPSFDPLAAGILTGSGPFVCRNVMTGQIGGGCAQNADGSLAGQSVSVGGRFLLTKYDFSSFSSRNYQYVRSTGNWPSSASGNFQEFSWADFTNDAKVDILDIATVAQCWDRAATGTCAYWDLPAPYGTVPGRIDIGELAIVSSRFDENWVSPFTWSQVTDIETFVP